jgi:hypothetical protein
VARISGYYFHHYPYFGLRGEQDQQNLYTAWDNTLKYYKEEHGEPIYEFDEEEEAEENAASPQEYAPG